MSEIYERRWRWRVLCAATLIVGAGSSVSARDLPAGAVVAFIPTTVCANLPGGWQDSRQPTGGWWWG